MVRIKKSDYIRITRIIIRKLFDMGCFGKGSVYIHVIQSTTSKEDQNQVKAVLYALIKQEIVLRKKKIYGWKYFLNPERVDKIKQILKERSRVSIIPVLLAL